MSNGSAHSRITQLEVQYNLDRQEKLIDEMLQAERKAEHTAQYGTTHDRLLALEKASKELSKQYNEDIEKAKTDASAQKRLDQATKNLAKALPGMTKGTLSAIKSFQKGDAINGSAAVMDIFASLSPFLGGLSTAGGPPGMLVGAIFSMVGEILRFFGPPQESLGETIKKALADLQAKDTEMNILAFRDDATVKIDALNYAILVYREILAGLKGNYSTLAVELVTLAQTGQLRPEALAALEQIKNPKVGGLAVKVAGNIDVVRHRITSFETIDMQPYWKTHAFLSNSDWQDHPLWPVVLDLWCRTYIDLLTVVVQVASLTNEGDEELWKACAPEEQKEEVKKSYGKLWSVGKSRLYEFEASNKKMLGKLAEIRTAAQNRGMCWHIGFTHEAGGIVHPVYAKDVVRQGGNTHRLTDNTSRISAAKDNASARQPTYHVVAVATNGDTTYGTMVAPYNSVKWERLSSLQSPSDIWAVAGGRADLPPTTKKEFCFYAAKGNKILGYHCSGESAAAQFYDRDVQQPITSVRVVHAPDSVPGDPDDAIESAENKGVMRPGVLDQTRCIVYGSHAETRSLIYVDEGFAAASGSPSRQAWIQGPWDVNLYSGLAVDQNYLWAFAPLGFACTTHVSVVRAAERYRATGNPQAPRWIYPSRYPSEITSDPKAFPVTKGFADLSACDDGTLVAAVFAPRAVIHVATKLDGDVDRSTYAAAYRVDIGARTMEVNNFTRASGEARRVHKLPIFCWSEFESLRETLERLVSAKAVSA